MRRFVLGDIHGMYDYLVDVLQKCGFDYENDYLYHVGDIVDRGPEPFECIDELLKIKNLILIKGNHDEAFVGYTKSKTGYHTLGLHNSNGAAITVQQWNKMVEARKDHYMENFFEEQVDYHITKDNILFVHGGFDPYVPIDEQLCNTYCWDRELIMEAVEKGKPPATIEGFKEIYIGHTPTIYWNKTLPIIIGNLINIDTGSGKSGPLTIMDIDTKEYWQSQHNFLPYGIINEDKEKTGEKQEAAGREE